MSHSQSPLLQPFTLPCGVVIKNRIAKAALTERLADRHQQATPLHEQLYGHWASHGAGLLITGNILVDRRYKESAGNIVLEDAAGLAPLQALTAAGTQQGTQLWAQISHGGRQSTRFSTFRPIAPSAVQLKKLGLFAKPRAMTLAEIKDVEDRYVRAAELCQQAGFTGVQIHAAHGYLLSQFLSPKTNRRTDDYGGDIMNRSRLLFDIIRRVRQGVGDGYPVSVKLNSADFQRGGFNEEDALVVIQELETLKIDLLEISGGTYENVEFFTKAYEKESTRQREAYFMDFATKIRQQSSLPLMITGGFRTHQFCEEVLGQHELDIIGFGRPFLMDRTFPQNFLQNPEARIEDRPLHFSIKEMRDMAEAGYWDYQILRLATGKPLVPEYGMGRATWRLLMNEMVKGWFR